MSQVTCHMSYVTCYLPPVTNANSQNPSPADCPIIQSRLIPDPKSSTHHTILWPQQTVRSSCWSLMFNGIRPQPTHKRLNSAYVQHKFLICRKIHSDTLGQVTMMFYKKKKIKKKKYIY